MGNCVPNINLGRLAAASAVAAFGHDPCHAIAAATNALENNFAGPPPEMGGISREILNESGKMTTAVKEALEETIDDIRKNPGEYLKEAAIGSAPYGDIVRKIANGHHVSAIEFGIETGLLFVGPIKGGIKAGGKIAGKLGATYAKKMERGAVKQANHVPASASTKTAKPNAVHNQSTKKTLDSGNAKQKELKKPNKTLPIRQGKPKAAKQTTHGATETPKRLTLQRIPNAGGTITSFVTTKEEVYYRVYSGSNTSGSFLTKVRPKNNLLAREGLALPSSNTAQFIQEVIVPSGTRLQRSRALPAFGKRGAMEQFELLEKIPKKNFKEGKQFK